MQEYIGSPPRHMMEMSPTKLKFFDENDKPLTLTTHKGISHFFVITNLGREIRLSSKTISSFLQTSNKDFVDFVQK